MKEVRIIFSVIGVILVLIGIVKVSIIGFYPSEAPLYIGIVMVGGVCCYIASKIKTHKDDE